MESVGMLGQGRDSVDQAVPTLEPDWGIFCGLNIYQEVIENCKKFTDICGDCLDGMDILNDFSESNAGN